MQNGQTVNTMCVKGCTGQHLKLKKTFYGHSKLTHFKHFWCILVVSKRHITVFIYVKFAAIFPNLISMSDHALTASTLRMFAWFVINTANLLYLFFCDVFNSKFSTLQNSDSICDIIWYHRFKLDLSVTSVGQLGSN